MNPFNGGAFGALLSEKLAELEAHDGTPALFVEETALDQLRHAAQQSVLAIEGGPLPRHGHHVYLTAPDAPPDPGQRHLNILH